MHVVRGVVKDYDWGRIDGLAPWSGGPSGGPQAELWFGAHPAGPSPVLSLTDPAEPDDATIGVLSDHLASDDAPLLVKLLAAGAPLSLQVHPDADLAARGFAAQQAAGAAAVAVFADGHEKTEMLVALEPFCALVGWREAGAAADVLAGCGLPADIVTAVRADDHPAAVAGLLGLDRATSAAAVPGVADAALAAGLPAGAVGVLARIAAAYPDDPGVFVAVLLDHVDLEPGDAVYVPAGVPHAYVDGLGLEVMTSSDNVLRLGLTRKLVSVPDAVAAFRDDRRARIVRHDQGAVVAPAGAPFAVALHRDGTAALPSGRYRVAVAIEGDVQVAVGHSVAVVAPGRAAVLPAADPDASVTVTGLAAVVTEGEAT